MYDFSKWGFESFDMGQGKSVHYSRDEGRANQMYAYHIDPCLNLMYISLDKPYKVNNIKHRNTGCYRIAYCQKGLYMTNMGDYQILVSNQSIYAGRSYKTVSYAQTLTQSCRAFNLCFYPEKLDQCQDEDVLGIKDIYIKLYEKLKQIRVNGIHIKSQNLINIANSLVYAFASQDQFITRLRLYEFLYGLGQENLDTNQYSKHEISKDYQIKPIIDYIDNNLGQKLTINHLCQEFSISKNKLIECFRETFGYTPYQYISLARMTQAQKLLSSTDLNITQVALKVGYDNPANFARAFKKIIGLSPSAYREAESKRM